MRKDSSSTVSGGIDMADNWGLLCVKQWVGELKWSREALKGWLRSCLWNIVEYSYHSVENSSERSPHLHLQLHWFTHSHTQPNFHSSHTNLEFWKNTRVFFHLGKASFIAGHATIGQYFCTELTRWVLFQSETTTKT